ncbi:Fruiting body protein SC1 [Hypsizygus marmoreus]|uniref:Hydrophobin n=1 Tax=Hypsizygus marmoreus TaxID=39966 RepID=A0A369JEJ3_HYPMA|nr:Fruiting body protein SC1 [Hypsizygus marmoreus]
MFARVSTLLCLALYVSASAIPRRGEYESQCNTGSVQCCNSVQDSHNKDVGILAALIGLDIKSITGQVGVTCSPLTAVGVGGNSCTQQPVCCSGNNFEGLIVVGCTPINISL